MSPAETIIEAVATGHLKLAEIDPALQWGALGAGVGGAGGLIRSLGSGAGLRDVAAQTLGGAALGGGVGLTGALGAKILGARPPNVRDTFKEKHEPRGDFSSAAGLGLLGAGGLRAAAGAEESRGRREALRNVLHREIPGAAILGQEDTSIPKPVGDLLGKHEKLIKGHLGKMETEAAHMDALNRLHGTLSAMAVHADPQELQDIATEVSGLGQAISGSATLDPAVAAKLQQVVKMMDAKAQQMGNPQLLAQVQNAMKQVSDAKGKIKLDTKDLDAFRKHIQETDVAKATLEKKSPMEEILGLLRRKMEREERAPGEVSFLDKLQGKTKGVGAAEGLLERLKARPGARGSAAAQLYEKFMAGELEKLPGAALTRRPTDILKAFKSPKNLMLAAGGIGLGSYGLSGLGHRLWGKKD